MRFPRLYPIADKATLDARGVSVKDFAREMAQAGVGVLQYRDKLGSGEEVLHAAREISAEFAGRDCLLIMNDRPELALEMGWGVHVGHEDMSPADVRRLMDGRALVIGVSTHDEAQVIAVDESSADYVAIGPVFGTSTKLDAQPVVGLEGVRRARALTGKPLVAIGGITLENAQSVIEAGADSVAVIGGLLMQGEAPGKIAKDFLEILR
ncbi:MAG: thiamine phosphate synthase [Acidobacteriaceae bacterium]